ncbi:MAG: 4Fe-4S dicluster domain-containing protein [Candidatus Eremiobacteraeota bacterium]|nr:4Fe-4S dicluster domain-containing protein [Candidatus Eremiobacteraeota bacterium]
MSSHGTLIAPVKDEDGYVSFKCDPDPGRITLDFLNTASPLRQFFMPPGETLFSFSGDQKGFTVQQEKPEKPMMIFGARLCDAAGLLALDSAFGGEYKDPSYMERRKNSLIAAVFCNEPHPTCFCECVQGLLSKPRGIDLLVYPLKEGFLIEDFTDKAADLLKKCEALLKEPSASQVREKEEILKASVDAQACELDFSALASKLSASQEAREFWDEASEGCLSCGVCSFVCPACQCFSVQDVAEGKEGKRVRCWATCQDCGFARMAGGIDPRPAKGERTWHRFEHKFAAAPSRNNMIFCTGCGRCIRFCPSHHDIIETMTDFLRGRDEVKA